MPEKNDDAFFEYSNLSRILLTMSGLVMSILILPLFCLLILNAFQGSPLNTILDFEKVIKVLYLHPLRYFEEGINMFPTLKYSNVFFENLACLAEISFFLGIVNLIPIPLLDGGQLLIEILECKFPVIQKKYEVLNAIGYLILIVILVFPLLIAFIKDIKNTYPLFILGAFLTFFIVQRYRYLFPKNKDTDL